VDFSFIIPVFNRPAEIDELLASLALQTRKGFEVVVVEDGSTQSSEGVVKKYRDRLDLAYFFTPNSGPGLSRNYGCERAKGEYMIFLIPAVSTWAFPKRYLRPPEAFPACVSAKMWI